MQSGAIPETEYRFSQRVSHLSYGECTMLDKHLKGIDKMQRCLHVKWSSTHQTESCKPCCQLIHSRSGQVQLLEPDDPICTHDILTIIHTFRTFCARSGSAYQIRLSLYSIVLLWRYHSSLLLPIPANPDLL